MPNDYGSHGLATLERRHVSLTGRNAVSRSRSRARAASSRSSRWSGPAASTGRRRARSRPVDADDSSRTATAAAGMRCAPTEVSAFLKELVGEEFSAKDFRTWHATVLAAAGVAVAEPPGRARARRQAISDTIEDVAAVLGNTPAVCRSSYIDPRVFDCYRAGSTIDPRLCIPKPTLGSPETGNRDSGRPTTRRSVDLSASPTRGSRQSRSLLLAVDRALQLGLVHPRAAVDRAWPGLVVELVRGAALGRCVPERRPPRRPEDMSRVDVRDAVRDSPLRARSLLTVRAAISSARSRSDPACARSP